MNYSHPFKFVKRQLELFRNDSLYRNAFWLMAGTTIMSGIGFFYWLAAARLYTPEMIGLLITFTSAFSLISNFSLLGFNTTIIRYLSGAKDKAGLLQTAFSVTSIASLFIGTLFIIGIPIFSSKLMFVRENITTIFIMLLFVVINTLSTIFTNIFTAMRDAKYVFISNTLQSLSRFIVLVVLFFLGIWGLIGSFYVSTLMVFLFGIYVLYSKYRISLRFKIMGDIIQRVKKYAFTNYLVSFIAAFPGYLLPLLITNRLSPESTAYFYMPNMIASLLAVVPSSISRSYFAESSHTNKPNALKKPMVMSYFIVTPIILLLLSVGSTILSFFGRAYEQEGFLYLILVLLGVFVSIPGYFFGSRLLVKRQMRKLTLFSILGAGSDLILYIWFINYGIVGIGVAVVLGYVQGTSMYITDYLISSRKNK